MTPHPLICEAHENRRATEHRYPHMTSRDTASLTKSIYSAIIPPFCVLLFHTWPSAAPPSVDSTSRLLETL